MCARYTQTKDLKTLLKRFLAAPRGDVPPYKPQYNIAPTHLAPVVLDRGGRSLRLLRWGLVPSWSRDSRSGAKAINARAETVAEKPAFRDAFRARRCLVPADGFYEWRSNGGVKTPYRFVRRDRESFAFAGLWEAWRGSGGDALETFTILTTEPNATVRPVHDRMPVILTEEGEGAWLEPRADAGTLRALLRPFDGAMEAYAVSPRVNAPAHDGPACVEPAPSSDGTVWRQGDMFGGETG